MAGVLRELPDGKFQQLSLCGAYSPLERMPGWYQKAVASDCLQKAGNAESMFNISRACALAFKVSGFVE